MLCPRKGTVGSNPTLSARRLFPLLILNAVAAAKFRIDVGEQLRPFELRLNAELGAGRR